MKQIAITVLALTALVVCWAGSTTSPKNDPVTIAVEKGAKWLVSVQGHDGGWGQDGGETSYVRQGEHLESNGNDVAKQPKCRERNRWRVGACNDIFGPKCDGTRESPEVELVATPAKTCVPSGKIRARQTICLSIVRKDLPPRIEPRKSVARAQP